MEHVIDFQPKYHPAPGDQISDSRIIDVVIKTGKANAYTLSINSPTLTLFKAQGMSIQDFVAAPKSWWRSSSMAVR